jgi:hypothetical protein
MANIQVRTREEYFKTAPSLRPILRIEDVNLEVVSDLVKRVEQQVQTGDWGFSPS